MILGFQGSECGGIFLDTHVFAGEVFGCLHIGIRRNHKYLGVVDIGGAEGVLVFPAIHGEPVPDAVNGAAGELHVLGIPVNGLLHKFPALHVSHSLRQFQVKAGVFAVFILVAIGREFRIEANRESLFVSCVFLLRFGCFVISGTPGAASQQCRCAKQAGSQFFHHHKCSSLCQDPGYRWQLSVPGSSTIRY